MSFCGLRKPRPLRRRKEEKGKGKSVQRNEDPGRLDVRDWNNDSESESDAKGLLQQHQVHHQRKKSADFDWAREDQLSTILEHLEESRKNTPNWENEPNAKRDDPKPVFVPKFSSAAFKKTRFLEYSSSIPEERIPLMSFSGSKTPDTPRSIAPPPRDVSVDTLEIYMEGLIEANLT